MTLFSNLSEVNDTIMKDQRLWNIFFFGGAKHIKSQPQP